MSLDGRRALTAGKNGARVAVEPDHGQEDEALPGKDQRDPLEFSLFSGNGRRFATFYESGAFCVWDEGQLAARRHVPHEARVPRPTRISAATAAASSRRRRATAS